MWAGNCVIFNLVESLCCVCCLYTNDYIYIYPVFHTYIPSVFSILNSHFLFHDPLIVFTYFYLKQKLPEKIVLKNSLNERANINFQNIIVKLKLLSHTYKVCNARRNKSTNPLERLTPLLRLFFDFRQCDSRSSRQADMSPARDIICLVAGLRSIASG